VLPALKSRGWNVEQINGREDELPYMKYTYDNRTWTNVALRCVLNESKSLHPELSNVIDKLLDSCSQQKEETISLTLDAETLTVEKLQEFLWKFAPLQLQFDGCKPKRRVASLNKRLLLNSCYNMHRAVKLVSRVSSTCDDKLSREINITNKAPHPYWKPIHDATLIRGIMKHGWLERSHDDIVNDESLNWDSLLEEDSDSCSISILQEETMSRRDKAKMLRRVADRTVRFFDKNDEFILTIKGFDREKTLLNYGIVTKYSKFGKKAFYSLDTTMLVDTEEEEKIEPCLDFPSKEKLVKRAKSILSPNPKKKQAPVAEVKTNDHGYPIMDESDRCYMLLSELLKGLVKLPFNKPHEIQSWFKTLKLAREEASNFTKLSEEMKQLHDHLLSMEGVGTNISITPLKNVIRAILGMKVAQQKNTESLFFVKKNPSTGEAALNSCLKAVSNENCLKLNYLEYFMLKVFISFGIPYSEHLLRKKFCAGAEFQVTWKTLATTLESYVKKAFRNSDTEEKQSILDEATSLRKDFESFAKKSVMLFESLRIRMGDEAEKDKSDCIILGTPVLNFFKQENLKYARHFAVYDKETKSPMTRTAVDLNTEEFKPFTYLDRAACRIIYGQIAQQCKLRSLFVKYDKTEITHHIQKATLNSKKNDDDCMVCPVWWNKNEDDLQLLVQLLDVGYIDFNNKKHDFCRKRIEEAKSDFVFDSALIQTRLVLVQLFCIY